MLYENDRGVLFTAPGEELGPSVEHSELVFDAIHLAPPGSHVRPRLQTHESMGSMTPKPAFAASPPAHAGKLGTGTRKMSTMSVSALDKLQSCEDRFANMTAQVLVAHHFVNTFCHELHLAHCYHLYQVDEIEAAIKDPSTTKAIAGQFLGNLAQLNGTCNYFMTRTDQHK